MVIMKKSLFFKSAFILLIGSLFTKALGFFIKIIFTRIIGDDGINLYSLIMPTYYIVIALTQLGLTLAISTVVAKNKVRGKTIIMSILPIILLINLVMMITIVFTSKYIAVNLLHNSSCYMPILSMAFVLPFISVSSILRGYFFGRQRMGPHTVSNIVEQVARLFIIVIFLPKMMGYGTVSGVCAFILLSIISEFISIVVFLIFLPKNFTIKKEDLKPDMGTCKEVMSVSIPSVAGRLIGNVGYFFEPIILTFVLELVGYSNGFILEEYGANNAYVVPLLMIPSFIVQSLSTALVPEISKNYQMKNIAMVKKRQKQSVVLSLILGIITNTFIFLFPEYLLSLVYKTTNGADYIRALAFIFILYNLENPLFGCLQVLGKTKHTFITTLCSVIIKTVVV